MTMRTMGGPGLLHLHELRPALMLALAPEDDRDPDVTGSVDAISENTLLVEWANPWLEPQTIGASGYWNARLNVVCFAARVEPEPGIVRLQELVVYVLDRLRRDERTWPVVGVSNPRNYDMAGLTYLGARLTVQVPTSIEGGMTP